MGAGVSVSNPDEGPIACTLKGLPDAIESCVFVRETWPMVVDPSGQSGRFLRYQRGSYLIADSPADMEKEHLRQLLVGALKHGSTMCIAFGTLGGITNDIESFFDDKYFPRALIENKGKIFMQEVWEPLLRPEKGDDSAEDFTVDGNFNLITVSEVPDVSKLLPEDCQSTFTVIRVGMIQRQRSGTEGQDEAKEAEDAAIAAAIGVKNVKRNSKDMVECAFDGDMEGVTKYIEQGYSVDSVDGRHHSGISEAACQGQNEVLDYLLGQGGDPNLLSDTGRSPLYRACFNGHVSTVSLLLEAGGDPTIVQKMDGEGPFDVAKIDEVREVLKSWDMNKTQVLKEERKRKMREELEKRLTTTAEREANARELIRNELVEMASKGDLEGLKNKLEQLAEEADREGEKRARGTAETRDSRGCTLLMIATENDNLELVEFLLKHWKTIDEGNVFLAPGELSLASKTFKTNVNARDAKGWNAITIASFRHAKTVIPVLLAHGADPNAKNQYGKSALDFADDELDAAKAVYKDNSEVRQIFEDNGFSKASGKCGLDVSAEELPKDGGAMALNIEVNKENEAAAAAASKKKQGKAKVAKKKKGAK